MAVHAIVNIDPVTCIGEQLTEMDDSKIVDTAPDTIDQISGYALQAGYAFFLSGHECPFAIGYEGTMDAMPESMILGAFGVGLTDNLAVVALEYTRASNYAVSDHGDGDDADTFIVN